MMTIESQNTGLHTLSPPINFSKKNLHLSVRPVTHCLKAY